MRDLGSAAWGRQPALDSALAELVGVVQVHSGNKRISYALLETFTPELGSLGMHIDLAQPWQLNRK